MTLNNLKYLFLKYRNFVYHSLIYPGNIYLFIVSSKNTRKRCEICSKLTIKTPEGRYCSRSVVFIVNSEQIFFTSFSSISIVDFEQVKVGQVMSLVSFYTQTFKYK